jgi:hypothetical protein
VITGKIIAPWSELVRYTPAKKYGYHGGLTPQECVVPCAVFVRHNQNHDHLTEWDEQPLYQPQWWSRPGPALAGPELKPAPAVKKSRKSTTGNFPLFEAQEATTKPPLQGIIDRLFASEIYASQLAFAGRGGPKPEDAQKFLQALEQSGGAMLKPAMAQHLGMPELRVAGVIAAMRRVLNLDGYAVLDVEESSGTIRLNLELLKVQFGLEDKA